MRNGYQERTTGWSMLLCGLIAANIGCESVVVDTRVEQLENELATARAALSALETDLAGRISALETGLQGSRAEHAALQSEFNNRTSALESAGDLVLRLDFDVDALEELRDMSPFGHELEVPAVGVVVTPHGRVDRAVDFSGGAITVSGNKLPDSEGVLMSLWVLPGSDVESQVLVSREHVYTLSLNRGRPSWTIEATLGSCTVEHRSVVAVGDKWRRLEAYYDGNHVVVRLDDVTSLADCQNGALARGQGGAIVLGGPTMPEGTINAFDGRMDDLRIRQRPPARGVLRPRCPRGWGDLGSFCIEPSPSKDEYNFEDAVEHCVQAEGGICNDQQLVYACGVREQAGLDFPEGDWFWTGVTIFQEGVNGENQWRPEYMVRRRVGDHCMDQTTELKPPTHAVRGVNGPEKFRVLCCTEPVY